MKVLQSLILEELVQPTEGKARLHSGRGRDEVAARVEE
jgi:hypothetical protein